MPPTPTPGSHAWSRCEAWIADRPLALLLPVQAALLIYHLDLLPAWGDEEVTVALTQQRLAEVLAFLRGDIHPPLYYLILHYWMRLPLREDPLQQIRLLSVICTLLAFVATDRCWLAPLQRRARWWFCALWAFSPCLLLYGRMARSYALQMLLATIALRAAYALLCAPRRAALLILFVLSAILLLYTHYLPGVAVVGGTAAVLLVRAVRSRDLTLLPAVILPPLLVGVAYLPWLPSLTSSLHAVSRQSPYAFLPNVIAEQVVRLAYTFISFAFGESLSRIALIVSLLLAPAVLLALLRAARRPPGWFVLVLTVAIIAYGGAGRWVSFAFTPARLLFLYPFFPLLLVHHSSGRSRTTCVARAGLLAVSLLGIGAYFQGTEFLNKGYLIPFDRIATLIQEHTGDGEAIVAIDHFGTNASTLGRRLPSRFHVVVVDSASRIDEVRALRASTTSVPTWLVRNTHDVSPHGVIGALEDELTRGAVTQRYYFVPYSPTDHTVMRLADWPVQPSHMIVVVKTHPE